MADIIGNDELKEKILEKYRKCEDKPIADFDTVKISFNDEPMQDIKIEQGLDKVVESCNLIKAVKAITNLSNSFISNNSVFKDILIKIVVLQLV